MTSYYTYYLQVLPDGLIRWVTLWEERFAGVDGEGEGHDSLGAGPHYHTLHPQSGNILTVILLNILNIIIL